jgi:hypothetical protein
MVMALHQRRTYDGLLIGYPYPEMNNRRVQETLDRAYRDYPIFGTPLLIEPVRTSMPKHPSDIMAHKEIPVVTCVAVFESNELGEPDSDPCSSRVIVWYQNQFALPIDPDVQSAIELFDWDSMATDWLE